VSEKRRGLGRGLGALIPSAPARSTGDRPVDVFFPDKGENAEKAGDGEGRVASESATGDLGVSLIVSGLDAVEASQPAAQQPRVPAPAATAPAAPAAPAPSSQGGRVSVPPAATLSAGAAPLVGDRPGVATSSTVTAPAGTAPTSAPTGPPVARAGSSAPVGAPLAPPTTGAPPAAGSAPAAAPTAVPAPSSASAPAVTQTPQAPAGHSTSGANGQPANGQTANGQPASGNSANGNSANGQLTPPSSNGAGATPADGSFTWAGSTPAVELVPVPGARFAELPPSSIRPNPRQPRQVFDEEALNELVLSIKEVGVLQPIVVREAPPEDGEPRYELIMGERRWRACQEAGLTAVPAIIRETLDDDLLRDALLENLHRSQLNALEEAAAYQQLLDDFGCTHEELATRIGRSRPQISNTLRLLKLPPLVQRRVAAGVLSAGHARALLGLEEPAGMEALAQRIVAEGLSVRAVEEIVAMGDETSVAKTAKKRPRAGGHHSELDELAGRLGDRLETRVSVTLGRNRGRLSIDFASVEDLNRILGVMSPEVRGVFAKSK